MSNNETKIISEAEKQEIIVIREFDAPRELVFKAYTDAELFKQWMGPRNLTMNLEKFDPRTGGSWRYVSIDKDGNKFAFNGVYHDVTFPERIINTFEFEGLPERGHVILETSKFEIISDNRTKIITQSLFQTIQDKEGMIQSGMEWGINESYSRLDELLSYNLVNTK